MQTAIATIATIAIAPSRAISARPNAVIATPARLAPNGMSSMTGVAAAARMHAAASTCDSWPHRTNPRGPR